MYRFVRFLLFLLPAEAAHRLGILALRALSLFPGVCRWMRERRLRGTESLAVDVAGVRWPHPVGLAAGLDKDAEAIAGFFALGFAAVEVGTVTPRPQPGNPKPRLFRIPEHHAVINRMGFNNHGADAMVERLRNLRWRPGPVGVNIGKNKDTPIERAVDDYLACIEKLGALADYVVVNASSPNTPGLRSLQEPEQLRALLSAVVAKMRAVAPGNPLFLKIAPDLTPEAVDEIVDVAIACGVAGLIATNTTIDRPFEHPIAKEAGGLSGVPVREKATAVIERAATRAAGRLPLIGVGGIEAPEHAQAKLSAGATAVQLYTGFIYRGPQLLRAILTRP